MTRPDPITRTWIIQSALSFYEAVRVYSRTVRGFCRLLGIRWPGDPRFGPQYFADRMKEARNRKKELRERVRALIPPRAPLGDCMVGLGPQDLGALDPILAQCGNLAEPNPGPLEAFAGTRLYDPALYKEKLQEALESPVVAFQDLPRVLEHPRLDLVFRFVTLVSMAHHGQVLLKQPDPNTILVIRREAAWESEAQC